MTIKYGLHLSKGVEGRLGRCRASVRAAIRDRLQEIAASAGKTRKAAKPIVNKEPALRFYVYEGYRILYQVDSSTRRVVVLDLGHVAPS